MDWATYSNGLLLLVFMASFTWVLSVYLRDVSIVDSLWPLMLLGPSLLYFYYSDIDALRPLIVISLVSIWGIRLFIHLTWRNWGEPEDRRYQTIRHKYEPHFSIKSLFIIFLFQAVLAWVISLPLFATLISDSNYSIAPPGSIADLSDTALLLFGIALCVIGILLESVADWQLAQFKNDPNNQGLVMDKGLWRYSRHPNYFGECLIWWGFYSIALSVGAWWSIISPIIMTWLLLKFSGVVMLEQTISERRPTYLDYIKRTNAFIPGPVRNIDVHDDKYFEEHA